MRTVMRNEGGGNPDGAHISSSGGSIFSQGSVPYALNVTLQNV
ncbi:unnamed protein product [Nippostrongylus brasiliensis]|uniref:Polyprotein n=1 Tax=Nippostrongylus brasiliensis TaxID=27835 RepID=A0A0N4XKG8_NIPBR|nr:unnamed protein product [Nippostrongylus brasiliensis]